MDASRKLLPVFSTIVLLPLLLTGCAMINPYYPEDWRDVSPDGRQVVFTLTQNGRIDIWTADQDGNNPRQLTDKNRDNGWPKWSPDGKQIAFCSTRDGNSEVYVMNADGSNQKRVTRDPATKIAPQWAPDGKKVFAGAVNTDDPARPPMCVVDLTNGDVNFMGNDQVVQLIVDSSQPEQKISSHDGSHVAICRGTHGLFLAAGTTQKKLTGEGLGCRNAAWSPDGSKIAFEGWPAKDIAAKADVYVADVNTGLVTKLVDTPGYDGAPCWFSSGDKLFISSDFSGGFKIYVTRLDGGGRIELQQSTNAQDWYEYGRGCLLTKGLGAQLGELKDYFNQNLAGAFSEADRTIVNQSLTFDEGKFYQEVESSLCKAIALDEHYLPAYKLLGLVLNDLNRPAEARAIYQKALTFAGRDSELLTAYGYCLVNNGDDKGALANFTQSIRENTSPMSVISARIGRAALLEKSGDKQAAEKEYEVIRSERPDIWEQLQK